MTGDFRGDGEAILEDDAVAHEFVPGQVGKFKAVGFRRKGRAEMDAHLDEWSRELRRVLGARSAVAIETLRVEALSARGRALGVG